MTPDRHFHCDIPVRFKDIDSMGHVNNAVIVTYFEEGRKALFFDAFKDASPGGFNFIMAHLECDYVRPVLLHDRLRLAMWVSAIGTKSFTLAYRLVDAADDERVFAEGASAQVCYDYHQRTSIAIPPPLRNALAIYHLPD